MSATSVEGARNKFQVEAPDITFSMASTNGIKIHAMPRKFKQYYCGVKQTPGAGTCQRRSVRAPRNQIGCVISVWTYMFQKCMDLKFPTACVVISEQASVIWFQAHRQEPILRFPMDKPTSSSSQ